MPRQPTNLEEPTYDEEQAYDAVLVGFSGLAQGKTPLNSNGVVLHSANRTGLLTCETAGIRIHVVMTRLITVIVPKQITRSDLCTLEEVINAIPQ
jgi:hypothetical protein